MDGLAVAQACRASGRLAAAQPKRLLTLAVQESNSTGSIGQASAPSRFQVSMFVAGSTAPLVCGHPRINPPGSACCLIYSHVCIGVFPPALLSLVF